MRTFRAHGVTMDLFRKTRLPSQEEALPGRAEAMPVPSTHYVNGHRMLPPFPHGMALALFGLGWFWGAERVFWLQPGVYSTMVGYAGGITPHPTYREVCRGLTGHNEVVRVVYDPQRYDNEDLLTVIWESHDFLLGFCLGFVVGLFF